jgi:hypothetical protein
VTGDYLNATSVDDDDAHLVVDGSTIQTPSGGYQYEQVDDGESVEMEYLFELPVDATDAELQVGVPSDEPDNTLKTFPLNLPDLP